MIVATLASLSSREKLLERTIESLAPQVDAICVYLNGYGHVPDYLKRDNVLHAVLSTEAGWRGAEAKLWFWDRHQFRAAPAWSDDDIALVCDDDLIYPPDYAQKMKEALEKRPGTVACVHGSIMTEPFERYAVSRMVARTVAGLEADTRVHIPGTGTMAFRVGDVAPHLCLRSTFQWSHSVDPHVAVLLHQRGIETWSVARPIKWIVVQEIPRGGMSIFPSRTGAGKDLRETEMLKAVAPWPTLEIAPDMTPRISQVNRRVVVKGRAPIVISPNPNSELPPEAMAWLRQHLATLDGGVVVELGSGFGTEKIAHALPEGVELVSVEHDPAFIGLTDKTTYIHAPIHNSWYDVRTLKSSLPPRDVIRAVIVDGPPAKVGRHRMVKNLDLFPDNVPMLIDDVHRDAEHQVAKDIAARRGQQLEVHSCGRRAFATIGW